MSKKTLLLIAAVAVMLVGATSAYGYYEHWDGWFNSGYLILYYESYEFTFDYTEGEGVLRDTTAGSVDSFFVPTITVSTFSCAESGPYEGWTIKLWPGASGSKPTGQSGQKKVNDGATWVGYARLYDDENNLRETFDVGGTWNTTVVEGDCFNYGGRPAIYSAHWVLIESDPLGLYGVGGSAGDLQD